MFSIGTLLNTSRHKPRNVNQELADRPMSFTHCHYAFGGIETMKNPADGIYKEER
jgi:hypothetical protein